MAASPGEFVSMTSIILSDGTVARTISGPVFLFDTGGFIQRYFTISDAVAAASANSSIFVSADTYSLFVHEPEAVKVAVNGLTIQVPELGHQGLQPVFMLTDDAIGLTLVGDGDARIVGNNADNALVGNDGDNFLSGGSGSDRMSGGNGNDTYFVDNVNDVTSELVMSEGVGEVIGTGDDVVYASVDFTLAAGIEVLIQTDDAIHGTGNDDNNYLYGNSEANVLDGGLGRDIMIGGAGDDTYIVDQLGDTIIENAGEGTDTVYSGIGFALAANVENLMLTGMALQGFGNDGDNRISGNDGINVLYGGAGWCRHAARRRR